MSQEIELYVKCPQCKGTRYFQPAYGVGEGPILCTWPECEEGNGYLKYGKLPLTPGLDEIADQCTDILDRCADILNKCNDIHELLTG